MKIVDLRSDTVTKPSQEMWEALRSLDDSKIGDDVEGEDPTVNELEEKAAKLMGKEAALYVTSGTQGNLVSLLSQTNPGDEILLEELSHIYKNEVGSAARIGGLMIRTYPSNKGVPSFDQLQKLIRDKEDIHEPSTTLFSVENTHNYHGGVIVKSETIKDMSEFSKKNDLKLHLDGARIFNAAIGLKVPVTEFTKNVDSVMFCLSKGLSCPVGSIVAGSKDFITNARRYRKMLGGGMRQAGIIASFGLIALEQNWIKRLEEDHKNAKLLSEGIESYNLPIKLHKPETNIVLVELMNKTRIFKIVTELAKEGIKSFNINKEKIRFVTHYGINEDDIIYSTQKIGEVLRTYLSN
ncbi:MAG: aminotransferase class I/II-fold pyridoxal phosphate-dependent enzyme [Candidatus Lokiarchaeota archaeon]|nr:aminotransferase class I/II-fold pyridoxal phosphate-dependent enzyme [Candidatus Lokiarchaeota archaeon]